jgi:hypothetical protein
VGFPPDARVDADHLIARGDTNAATKSERAFARLAGDALNS